MGSAYSLLIGRSAGTGDPGVFGFQFLADTGVEFWASADAPLDPSDGWHYLLVTRSRWLNVYVDGRWSGAIEDSNFGIQFNAPDRVGIGLSGCGSSHGFVLHGSIAQVAVYGHALDPATIAEHAALGGRPVAPSAPPDGG